MVPRSSYKWSWMSQHWNDTACHNTEILSEHCTHRQTCHSMSILLGYNNTTLMRAFLSLWASWLVKSAVGLLHDFTGKNRWNWARLCMLRDKHYQAAWVDWRTGAGYVTILKMWSDKRLVERRDQLSLWGNRWVQCMIEKKVCGKERGKELFVSRVD